MEASGVRVATCMSSYVVVVDCFFDLGIMARQDYFTPFEPSQLLGRAKAGDPPRKNARKQNLACLMSWTRFKPTAVRWRAI